MPRLSILLKTVRGVKYFWMYPAIASNIASQCTGLFYRNINLQECCIFWLSKTCQKRTLPFSYFINNQFLYMLYVLWQNILFQSFSRHHKHKFVLNPVSKTYWLQFHWFKKVVCLQLRTTILTLTCLAKKSALLAIYFSYYCHLCI